MARYLRDTHPLHEKFDALAEAAEELKIKVYVEGHEFVVTDLETGVQAVVCDLDPYHSVWDIPPTMEYRLRLLRK